MFYFVSTDILLAQSCATLFSSTRLVLRLYYIDTRVYIYMRKSIFGKVTVVELSFGETRLAAILHRKILFSESLSRCRILGFSWWSTKFGNAISASLLVRGYNILNQHIQSLWCYPIFASYNIYLIKIDKVKIL